MKTSLRLAASLFLMAALFPLLTATGAAKMQATDAHGYCKGDTTDTIILHVPDSVPVGNAKDAA